MRKILEIHQKIREHLDRFEESQEYSWQEAQRHHDFLMDMLNDLDDLITDEEERLKKSRHLW